MASLNGFNANEVEPSTGFEPVPAGCYLAAITSSELKPTKSGTGSYMELTFTILEGEHRNRMVWARLCLEHPNHQTVRIARAQLSAICRAVGVQQPRDSVELHNIPLQIKVSCKKRKDTDEITNEIKGFEPKSAATGVPQQAPNSAPPWRR